MGNNRRGTRGSIRNTGGIDYASLLQWDDKRLLDKVKKGAGRSNESIAKEMVQLMKRSTLFADKKGNLRKSIKAYKSKYKNGGWVAGAWAPHAHLVELGSQPRFHEVNGKHVGSMPAKPFIRMAWEIVKNRVLSEYREKTGL